MTNVLYVSNLPGFLGGAERSLYELLKNIDRTKVSPFFASIHNGELTSSIKELGIPVLRLNPFDKRNPVPFILSVLELVRFIVQNRIHLIHNNQCFDARYSWFAGKITRTPIIIHHRDSKFFRLDRFLIKHAECNVSISSWLNRELLLGKAIVIYNGIEFEKFNAVLPPCQNKNGRIEVGLIGRISPIKGQDAFIEAAKLVVHRYNKKAHFKIIGDIETETYGEYKNRLRSLVKEYQLENDVEFTGYANDIIDALGQLDISVVPSLREPFGRVIVESMACYKPVIATNVGGALDIVTDQTGLLVPVNDPETLADAILFLSENPTIRASMGKAGRERLEKYFTIEITLSKIYDLYDKILHTREAKRC